MSEESSSPVAMIVIIVAAALTILYALISGCMGTLGLAGSVGSIAILEGDYRIMGIISAALSGLNVLTCAVMVIGAIVALIKRGLGRWILPAVLVLALAVDVVIWGGALANNIVFLGANIVSLISGGVVGLIVLVVKCLAYVVVAALVLFLGKER